MKTAKLGCNKCDCTKITNTVKLIRIKATAEVVRNMYTVLHRNHTCGCLECNGKQHCNQHAPMSQVKQVTAPTLFSKIVSATSGTNARAKFINLIFTGLLDLSKLSRKYD